MIKRLLQGLVLISMFFPRGLAAQRPSGVEGPTVSLKKVEVPDYLAWRYFFYAVDSNYRLGERFYYGFVNMQLKLGPLFAESERSSADTLIQVLADRAAFIIREEDRFSNESRNRLRFVELGGMTEAEALTENRQAFRRQVGAMRAGCDSLRRDIERVAPRSAAAIWKRVVEYVSTTVKGSVSARVGPNVDAYEAMLEFQSPTGREKPEEQ